MRGKDGIRAGLPTRKRRRNPPKIKTADELVAVLQGIPDARIIKTFIGANAVYTTNDRVIEGRVVGECVEKGWLVPRDLGLFGVETAQSWSRPALQPPTTSLSQSFLAGEGSV
jgi:hypothetical protein